MKRLWLILFFILLTGCSPPGRLVTDYFGQEILLKQIENSPGEKYVFLESVKKDNTTEHIYYLTFKFCEDYEPDYTIETREYIQKFSSENGYTGWWPVKGDKQWISYGDPFGKSCHGFEMKRSVQMIHFATDNEHFNRIKSIYRK